ncbi:MAG: condensation domain-containing protein, partial [Mycobacterium sp.]
PDPATDTWASLQLTDVATDTATTRRLLDQVDAAGIELRDFLLAALTMTITSWRVARSQPATHGALIALEGHGREDGLVGEAVDTSATVGWFTSVFPVRLGAGERPVDVEGAVGNPAVARALLRSVSDHLAAVPNRGLDFGLLRYHRRDPGLADARHPQLEFNFIGRHDLGARGSAAEGTAWSLITDPTLNGALPTAPEPKLALRYTFDVISVVNGTDAGPQLLTSWRWSDRLTSSAEAAALADLWSRALRALGDAL